MTPGLVSVVVPSYNHAEFLDRRMQSLLAQSYAPLEIIVIDDRSSANNLEILEKYRTDPRVRVMARARNGGITVVTNQGIELAAGEYVIFAQCDDACDPRLIERLVAALSAHPSAVLAWSRSLMIDEADRILGDDYEVRERAFRRRCAADALLGGQEMRRFLFHSCVIPNLSGALFRRAAFRDEGVFSAAYRACIDWDLFFRLCARHDFFYIAEPLNHFRQHGATIRSATKGRVTYEEFFRLLLGEIRRGGLSPAEHLRFRLHVMHLWAVDLLRPSLAGWINFPVHFSQIWRLDPAAIAFLPAALLQRALELPWRALARLRRGLRNNAA